MSDEGVSEDGWWGDDVGEEEEEEEEAMDLDIPETSGESSGRSPAELSPFQSAKKKLEDADFDNEELYLTVEEVHALANELAELSGQASQPLPAGSPKENLVPYYLLLGDYAGRMWKLLKIAANALADVNLPDRVAALWDKLLVERGTGGGPMTGNVRKCVKYLRENGLRRANFEMAVLAIEIYTERNRACHSEVGAFSKLGDSRMLREAVAKDIDKLPDVLTDSVREHRKSLERLMRFFRDSSEWLVEQEAANQTGVCPKPIPATESTTGKSGDAVGGGRAGDKSPVKSRSISPSKRTVSGSLKPARDDQSTISGASDLDEEGLRAGDGIREDIAKLRLKDNDSMASTECEVTTPISQEAMSEDGDESAIVEESPRKRGRRG